MYGQSFRFTIVQKMLLIVQMYGRIGEKQDLSRAKGVLRQRLDFELIAGKVLAGQIVKLHFRRARS